MSVKWTKEQQQVIDQRGKNILVSAAAGSGKTAVLVERITKRILDEIDPLHVDEILVVTFTEAAAAEMKERIGNALSKALDTAKDKKRLKKEIMLLPFAQISTIHSFCLRVIKENFTNISLEPGFRVGENTEMELLKRDVAENVLTMAYEDAGKNFLEMIDILSPGKTDAKIIDLLIKVYDFSGSEPDINVFLDGVLDLYQGKNNEKLKTHLRRELDGEIVYMKALLEGAINMSQLKDGPAKYIESLELDLSFVEALEKEKDLDKISELISNVSHPRLARITKKDDVDERLLSSVKEYREEYKKSIKKLAEGLFSEPFSVQAKMINDMSFVIEEFILLLRKFEEGYAEEKRRKNLLDFRDMEQFALEALVQKEASGYRITQAAEEYREQFREVMVDEYQDSNNVQEMILNSVTRDRALFMVGDVKQSIYGFRLACPELFMSKYHDYEGENNDKVRIDLSKNFRSRKKVLDSTNIIFSQIMQEDLGGITYDLAASLAYGASYEDDDNYDTDLLILDTKNLDNNDDEAPETGREKEARMTARYIKEFIKDGRVYDKKEKKYRKASYGDIVILMRSMKGWSEDFVRILKEENIPADAVTKEGYFSAWEVSILLDYLNLLDNFQQDISLAAVLLSPIGGLTGEELARIRIEKRDESLSRAVIEMEDEMPKIKSFMEFYREMRNKVPYTKVCDLIGILLDKTGFMELIGSMPGGAQRRANVSMLITKARDFENTSYHGLFHFIRYIEQLKKYNVDFGEATILEEGSDTVHIMSIHKSKGLEFPVVIVSGLGKMFNRQDQKGQVLLHKDLGVGIDFVDLDERKKTPLLTKNLIKGQMEKDMLAEELRVLYVAMTRAEEKLVLTGQIKDAYKNFINKKMLFKYNEKVLPLEIMLKANSLMDFICMALIRNKCFGGVLGEAQIEMELLNSMFKIDMPFTCKLFKAEELKDEVITPESENTAKEEAKNIKELQDSSKWEEKLSYKYPYIVTGKRKYSVTEITKKEDITFEKTSNKTLGNLGIKRGNAYHRIFELIDFASDENVLSQIEYLEDKGLLDGEEKEFIKNEKNTRDFSHEMKFHTIVSI